MSSIPSFPFSLPEDFSPEEFYELVPAELWKIDPETAGILALRRSGKFDEKSYLEANLDVQANGMGAIEHYIKYGAQEHRTQIYTIPKVSVLVPVYNNAKYLHECIDSILNQTLQDIEVIIIDDGSTDPTAISILDNYAQQDQRVKVVHKKNSGYGHSMNVGLDFATGEYIAIVESDDYILPEMFETYTKVADKYNTDFIKSSFKRFIGDGKERRFEEAVISKESKYFNCKLNPRQDILLFRQTNVIWNGIYRRSFLLKNNIRFNETPGASYQDNGFWFQTFIYTENFRILPQAFYMLRRDNSESSFFSKKKVFCMCDEYMFIYNILKKQPFLYKKFIHIFYLKKFYNYMFTFNRIGDEYKEMFLERFSQEFNDAYRHNELDRRLFSTREWENIQLILNDQEKFLMRNLQERKAEPVQNTPEVSVIVPVYNAEKYLKECISSIQNQSLKNVEIICVDDDSRDNSLKLLKEFASKDSRISIIKNQHGGAGAARNAGLQKAQGNYIIFLDADDYFAPDMLKTMQKNCMENNADFCVCRSKRFETSIHEAYPIDWTIDTKLLPNNASVFSPEDIKNDIFRVVIGWAWDKMYKKSFIDQHQIFFQEQASTNDMLFTFSTLIMAKKISICNEYFVFQRIGNPASVSNSREKSWKCFVEALRAVKKMLIQNKKMLRFEKDFISYCLHAYIWNFQSLKGCSAVELQQFGNEFAKEFSIAGKNKTYFSDQKSFETFMKIITLTNH